MIRRGPRLARDAEAATLASRPGGAEDPDAAAAVRQADAAGPGPTVVYIAGSGRSGSTLLERVLGELRGFVAVGELIDLFRFAAARAERCGCGRAFADCPFWAGVGRRAFGGWEDGEIAAVHQLQPRVARQRHIPRLLAMRLAGRGFRADVASYGASYQRLYRAVATEAGAAYVVDASKWPVQALALSRAGIDVRVLHLVRDVRGVAHSLGKRDVPRPHAVQETSVMWRSAPPAAAARWVACQVQAELLRRRGLPVARVCYEDFVRQPRRTVETALARLGLPPDPSHLTHLGATSVTLGPGHGLSGNPSRFSHGEVTLHADEGWRERMSRRDRVAVTLIGLPLLLRYGWRPRSRALAAGQPAAETAPQAAAMPGGEPWPLVSVIITTRGRPELVRETIAAVIAQVYPGDIECIVVHDQEPPDESLAALGSGPHRVRVAANTRSPGLAGARNTGVGLAGGGYIATCDDDDVWHPDKLRLQVALLAGQPDLLVAGSGIRLRLPRNKSLDWPGRQERLSYQFLLRNRVKELHSSTLVMRRDAFAKVGPYDEKLPHGYAEDYDWVLRAAQAGRIGVVAQPLADIRKDAKSWYRGSGESVAAGLEYLLAKHPDIASSARGHARMLGQIALARSSLGERGPAMRYAMRGLARWPASPYPYIALVHTATGIHPRHLLRTARLFRRGMA